MLGIRVKFIFVILFLVFTLGLVLLFITLSFGSDIIKDYSYKYLLSETEKAGQIIQSQNILVEAHIDSLEIIAKEEFDYDVALQDKSYLKNKLIKISPFVKELLEEVHASHKAIISDYVTYSVEDFKDVYQVWYAFDNEKLTTPENEPISSYTSGNPDAQWYYGPKESGKPMWTEVYRDEITGVPMVSYVKPLYYLDGRFLGIVGMDLSLEGVTAYLESLSLPSESYAILLDQNNNYISNLSEKLNPELFKELRLDKGIFSDNIHTFAYFKLQNKQTIIIVSHNVDLFQRLNETTRNLIILTCIILIFSSFLGYFLFNPYIKGINQLSYVAEQMINKNFKARTDIHSKDELENLGNAFNKAMANLEVTEEERKQIDKAKTEFLSITSHELRSPMTPMIGQLQMILKNYFGKINTKQRESLEIVLNNTERLDKIIVDFLEISRIEAARLKFNFVKTNLTKTIYSVVKEMKEFMPEKKIKIDVKIEKLPIIEVDPDRVSQILRNLLTNAMKFTPENGKIEISAKIQNKMILFSVKDNGIGISEGEQRRLFEPFYQIDNMYQHKSGGTGLGLAIAKGIVESQNGRIWLTSQSNKGTSFYFTVPLKPVKEVKAIRLLFSNTEQSDEKIKELFKKYIGPLGEQEFETLKKSGVITYKLIKHYIFSLEKKGILSQDRTKEFKNEIAFILKGEKEAITDDNISEKDIKKFVITSKK
jgi:signal transduction histidine kinase